MHKCLGVLRPRFVHTDATIAVTAADCTFGEVRRVFRRERAIICGQKGPSLRSEEAKGDLIKIKELLRKEGQTWACDKMRDKDKQS